MSEKFFIWLDGSVLFPLKCNKECSLKELRSIIISKKEIPNFVFLLSDEIIDESNEDNFSIEDIIEEKNKIKLRTVKVKKTVLPGCEILEKNDDLEIYSYPNSELNEIEKLSANTKNILFIGQSGVGKTTFINALINALLNINEEDNIRYKMVFKETKKGQHESQTDKINIYNIKISGQPILRVIDTPGFIDTEGKEKDEKYFDLFRNLFQNEISYLNCICFVMKSSDIRYNEIQKAVFDNVTSLFSKEIKNNFVFILTNYTYTGKNDAKEALFQNEIFKDLVNDENCFKIDSECAFNGEKELRNLMWKKTKKELERLIIEKFYLLESVDTKLSGDVIEKRKEHQNLFQQKLIEFKDKLKEIRNLSEKDFKRSLTVKYNKKDKLTTTNKNTICNKCIKTCHKNCICKPLMGLKYFCNVFGFLGFCKYCGCHFSRHTREKIKYIDKEETITFQNEDEKNTFLEERADSLKKNFEIDFEDLNNVIDKSILSNENNDPKEHFFNIIMDWILWIN